MYLWCTDNPVIISDEDEEEEDVVKHDDANEQNDVVVNNLKQEIIDALMDIGTRILALIDKLNLYN